jgi:PAS domain S-box-containing protein
VRERRPSGIYRTDAGARPNEQPDELEAAIARASIQQSQLELACDLLERERAKYIDLLEHSDDARLATEFGGSIAEANVAAGILFGLDRAAMVGRPLISFVARQDTREFRARLRELQGGVDVCSTTLRMRPRGGAVFWAVLCARVVRGVRGKWIALHCTIRKREVSVLGP